MEVVISQPAKSDIARAFAWHESARPGLGTKFLESVDQAVAKIARNPLTFRKVRGENRRVNLEKFQYALFYSCVRRGATRSDACEGTGVGRCSDTRTEAMRSWGR